MEVENGLDLVIEVLEEENRVLDEDGMELEGEQTMVETKDD